MSLQVITYSVRSKDIGLYAFTKPVSDIIPTENVRIVITIFPRDDEQFPTVFVVDRKSIGTIRVSGFYVRSKSDYDNIPVYM